MCRRVCPRTLGRVSTTTTARTDEDRPGEKERPSLVESVLDNLGVWTVVAAAIAFLYLVWATLEILGRYVGPLPKVGA